MCEFCPYFKFTFRTRAIYFQKQFSVRLIDSDSLPFKEYHFRLRRRFIVKKSVNQDV
jgi:hypothetical protein